MALIDMLPPEVLAHCFAHLFFSDRLAVTLVSCTWRATALASPEVWTHIDISTSMKSPESVLALALSRTGKRFIHLTIDECYQDVFDHGRFIAVLNPHMDRVRSIYWTGATQPFEHPAPALESFTHFGPHGRRFTENLLGGQAGQLRRLDINTIAFPILCPAVTLLTELEITIISGRRADPTDRLGDLFFLFPQLRALTLIGVKANHALILHSLSPPSSLSALHLQTVDSDVDLLDLYDSWSSGHLTDVALAVRWHMKEGLRLTSFLSDALELVVDQCESFSTRLLVLDSRTRKRRLSLEFPRYKIISSGFEAAHDCLTHLRALTISVDLWSVLRIRSPSILPALKEITLALDQMRERWTSFKAAEVVHYIWPWDQLEHLSAFVYSLSVDILTLEMRRWSESTPPTLQDAEKLLREHIPALFQPWGARIRVRGMPREVVDGLSANELRELRPLAVSWEVGSIVRPSQWARH